MENRHGFGADASAKAIAHHEISPGAELGQEARDVGELVAVVGVGHEDILSAAARMPALRQRRSRAEEQAQRVRRGLSQFVVSHLSTRCRQR